jgi:hypothetical protein
MNNQEQNAAPEEAAQDHYLNLIQRLKVATSTQAKSAVAQNDEAELRDCVPNRKSIQIAIGMAYPYVSPLSLTKRELARRVFTNFQERAQRKAQLLNSLSRSINVP